MLFKAPKKKENASIAEEIKITHIRNYYNDSLANEQDNEEEEEEVEEEEQKNEKEKEKEKEKNFNIEEIIEIKRNDETSRELKKDSEIQKEANKEDTNTNNKIIDDKTSSCHYFLYDGEDIDISRKKLIKCYQQTNNIMLIKNFTKVKKLLFIEDQYLYVLKDLIVDKNNERIRRVARKFDLSKLYSIETKKENKKYVFKFQFLIGDYFERETKYFVFEKKEGKIFYDLLFETLEDIESTFFGDFSDDEYEEEEEEEDDEDNPGNVEDSMNDVDMSAKHINPIYDKGNDLISSSRKKII